MTNWKPLYSAAHQRYQLREYPSASRDFGTLPTQYPDVRTANGLTRMIVNFLTWEGWRATRVNTQGQYAEQKHNGRVIIKGWRPSTTRKGTADISATIKGRSCMFEIKIGKDKPHPEQLKEQERERAAGGVYEFIYTPEEFFQWYELFLQLRTT